MKLITNNIPHTNKEEGKGKNYGNWFKYKIFTQDKDSSAHIYIGGDFTKKELKNGVSETGKEGRQ